MRGTILSLLVGSALVLEAAAFLPALQRPSLSGKVKICVI